MPYYGLIQLISCMLASGLHARFGVANFSFLSRTKFILLLQGLSYALLAAATALSWYAVGGSHTASTLGFGISLIAAVTSGGSQGIGEVLVVSRCYHLPPATLGAWGIGTGVSGLVAPVVYAWSKSLYPSTGVGTVFFMLSLNVLIPIFYFAFMYVDQHNTDLGAAKGHETTSHARSDPLTLASAGECMRTAGAGVLNFGAVYFLEYLITQSFLDRSTLHPHGHGLVDSNAYALSYAGYNLGVALSRGVVGMMPSPPIALIWIPTLLQLANCVFWAAESSLHSVRYEWFVTDTAGFEFYGCCMMVVGLMGGTSYSACYAYFRDTPTVPDRLREVLVNVSYGVSSLGMLLSSLSAIILSKTILSECSIYPCLSSFFAFTNFFGTVYITMSAVAAAPASLGFHAPGLITGTIIFAVLGVVFTFVAPILFAKETPKITKGESIRLSILLVWLTTICMWMFWAFVYMHQMVPLMNPIRKNPLLE
ncbi:hypothetical protein FOZ61_008224 [Perkinsus olseni]|nr:hypothetical protein FOZ61_008224 [Perkinsus olseni]